MKNHFHAVILVVTFLFTAISFSLSVSAALISGEGRYYYSIKSDNTATLKEYHGNTENLIIPSYVGTYLVSTIGQNTFYNNKNISSVIIPDSVSSVGSFAFYGCTNLKSVKLSSTQTQIRAATFYGCSSLQKIFIPSSVTSIASNSFNGCTNVTIIAEPGTTAAGYAETKGLSFVDVNSITTDNDEISKFVGARVLLEPDSGIGLEMYMKFSKAIIENPTSVMCITASNSEIEEVSIMKDAEIATVEGENCYKFICHTAAKELTDNVTMQVIDGDTVCEECSYSVKDYAETLLSKIATNNATIKSVTIPDSIKTIGVYAFYGCTSLESATIPSSVMSIKAATFYGCTNLHEITIPSNVTIIAANAFNGCDNLTIKGETASYAETYANERGIAFESTNAFEPHVQHFW